MSEPSHPFLNALHRFSRIGSVRRPHPFAASGSVTAPGTASHASEPAETAGHAAANAPCMPSLPEGAVLRHLPAVGLIVALGQVLVYGLTSLLLPHAVAVLLTMAAGLLFTGAVHERGAAFWWDQRAGYTASPTHNPGDASMTASGAGTVGLILLLLMRFETFASLDESWLAAALVCAASASRGLAVLGVAGLPRGIGRPPITRADTAVALLIGLVPGLALAAWTGDPSAILAAIGCAVVALAVLRGLSRRRAHAGTDTLSVMQQVTEVAWLIGMLAVLGAEAVEPDAEDGDS